MNESGGRRIALLIGNQVFPGDPRFSRLHGPKNDVEALREILADTALGHFNEIEIFIDRERGDILPRIEEVLSDTSRLDFVLIYYAGHGFTDNKGQLCLATKDTRSKARYATSIPGEHLKSIIGQARCQTVALLLDCCYSGAIDSNTRSDIDASVQKTLATNGLFVLTASTSIQTAGEAEVQDGNKRMGRFTSAIVDGIKSGAADINKDGLISLSDLADWTQKTVRGQEPRFWAMNAQGDPTISFVRSQAVRPAQHPINRLHHPPRSITADDIDVGRTRYRRMQGFFTNTTKILRERAKRRSAILFFSLFAILCVIGTPKVWHELRDGFIKLSSLNFGQPSESKTQPSVPEDQSTAQKKIAQALAGQSVLDILVKDDVLWILTGEPTTGDIRTNPEQDKYPPQIVRLFKIKSLDSIEWRKVAQLTITDSNLIFEYNGFIWVVLNYKIGPDNDWNNASSVFKFAPDNFRNIWMSSPIFTNENWGAFPTFVDGHFKFFSYDGYYWVNNDGAISGDWSKNKKLEKITPREAEEAYKIEQAKKSGGILPFTNSGRNWVIDEIAGYVTSNTSK